MAPLAQEIQRFFDFIVVHIGNSKRRSCAPSLSCGETSVAAGQHGGDAAPFAELSRRWYKGRRKPRGERRVPQFPTLCHCAHFACRLASRGGSGGITMRVPPEVKDNLKSLLAVAAP